jgi:cytochrome oxidase Cu insertion factor (SCO1/SenC/PrrC family)
MMIFCLSLFAPLAVVFVASAPAQAQQKKKARVKYVCPMHPEVTANRRGRCPKCGMNLKVVSPADQAAQTEAVVPMPASAAQNDGEIRSEIKIPDTVVYDQDGRKLNFYTDLVKGKTVAINFIFTTCTTICPPMTATFKRVQQTLDELGTQDVQLISISVDPTTDVPERLKTFSSKFKAGPNWKFITGGKPEIDELLRALGGFVADKNDHTPLILIGNDTAKFWTRTYGLAPASKIAGLVKEASAKSEASASHVKAENKKPEADTAAAYFPNLELLTQDNKPVRFYDDLLKGKVVLINFLFTTCKGVCSPMTANLAKVQKYLGERVGKEVVMLSISVDPETDTPPVLKKYSDSFHAQPGWYFLTGDKKNVDTVLTKLGGYVADKQQHSAVLLVGNVPTGEWLKVPAMSSATEIADAVVKMAGKQ